MKTIKISLKNFKVTRNITRTLRRTMLTDILAENEEEAQKKAKEMLKESVDRHSFAMEGDRNIDVLLSVEEEVKIEENK